ncbi:hypothetical protein DL95DRAFT_469928 [Leptodontidium sp. 2 PMI_412]|nr:hypothetical protein DL95DRAFT_469928 [Leptodontidium sp. 2 PMI_412]
MSTQIPRKAIESPQMQHTSSSPRPPQASAPPTSPSNFTNSLHAPQASQVAGPGQKVPGPTGTGELTGQYIAPFMSSPQSYQHPTGQCPPPNQPSQPIIPNSATNPSLGGHQIQSIPTAPNEKSLPSPPGLADYSQRQRHMQNPPQNIPYQGAAEKSQPQSWGHEVHTAQPELVKGMECVEQSEEERKKQRRAEQLAKTRHCVGQTCIIMGKTCIVMGSVMAAACSVVMCLASCLPGGSVGMMGGGGGFDISMPT